MTLYKSGILFLLAIMLAGCESPGQGGTPPPSAALRSQYDAAFQAMLKDPGNAAVVLNYAQLATRAGDLEGAAGAYEGLLLVDPNLPQVKLQLGILYYRLKSYDMSRVYLEQAVQSPALTEDLRKPALTLLAKMPKQKIKA
jgi:tetratricopeptide (TPR) repeat protein